MNSARQLELLEGAAQDFIDCNSPLNSHFLTEHDVTFDECMETSEFLGYILRGYYYAPPAVQANLLLVGATWPSLPAAAIFDAVLEAPPKTTGSRRFQGLLRALARDCLALKETFSHEFLLRHNVKASECIDLSQQAGYIVRGYLHAERPARDTILICGVAGKTLPGEFVFSASLQQHLLRKLKALKLPTTPTLVEPTKG